jgi:adenylosuccinate synthase
MSIDIVVGGQYGSEGKGKVTYELLKTTKHKCAIRVGGSNSGHTAAGVILRHLPVSSLLPDGIAILGPGSYINANILLSELASIKPRNFFIHEHASLIIDQDIKSLHALIGSTLSGTGSAVTQRIERLSKLSFAAKHPQLQRYIISNSKYRELIRNGAILEGTQGFGLSVLHSPYYPFVTSRDTTASGFAMEAGLSPREVKDIILVLRTYPIRVSGNSGPMSNEITWKELKLTPEITSVTKRIRRVALFDFKLAKLAIEYNKPTQYVLNHVDYILKKKRKTYIKNIEKELSISFSFIGLGPKQLLFTG